MFFMKNGDKLYLRNWEYNTALMLDELEKIIVAADGRVKENNWGYIVNGTVYDEIQKAERDYETFKSNIDIYRNNADLREKCERAAEKARAKAEELKSEADRQTPEKVNHLSYITFCLDGFVYYFQTDSNPFFPFYYNKAKLDKDGTYSRDAGLE